MAKAFAKKLYASKAWHQCRQSYLSKVYGLCERCLDKGILTSAVIVHHKVYLSEKNIDDVTVTLNHDNLEAVCIDCHNREHFADDAIREDVTFDDEGNLVKKQ